MKKLFAVTILGAICAMMVVPAYACYYTPGYWKNHPDAWPMDTVTICGTTYTKAEAIEILMTPPKGGDLSIKLGHHLIAAKLNFASGATAAYDGGQLIDDAEAALCAAGGIGSNPSGSDREACEYYLELLDVANNTPW